LALIANNATSFQTKNGLAKPFTGLPIEKYLVWADFLDCCEDLELQELESGPMLQEAVKVDLSLHFLTP
jgi:hypothetical protein